MEKRPELRYQQVSEVKTMVETVASTPPSVGVPASAGAGQKPLEATTPTSTRPAKPLDIWQRLKLRFWPPLVGRCGDVRMINWPAVAMRGLRALMIGLIGGGIVAAGVSVPFGPKISLLAGAGYLGFVCILAGFVMTIRILRGFAMPLTVLPELDRPSHTPPMPPMAGVPASGKLTQRDANPLPVLQFWQALEDADYARSWELAAPYFQRDIGKDEWMARMERSRRPLGKAVRREQSPSLWLNVGTRQETRCKTTFDSERTAMETAVAALQPNGEWRIESYRLDSIDAVSATATPSPLHEPRCSRTAIVGACFAALGLLMAASVLLQPQVMRAWGGLSLLFGPATILGWIAVTQIRRSTGKLCGLGLAVFDGLLFPLLALDGVFAGVGKGLARIFVEFNSNLSNLNNPQVHPPFVTRLANLLSQHHELAPLIAVVIIIVVDLLVIRAVWRAVNRQVAQMPIAQTKLSTALALNVPLATMAACAAWASGIFAGITWSLMPQPPAVLVWAILGAALAAVGLAIPARHLKRGRFALGFGVVQTLVWVIFWFLFALVTPLPEAASDTRSFGPPFVARLQQGTVELLALAPHPSTNAPSWHPDGSPASERFPSRGGSDSAAGKVVKEIAFRVSTQAESPSCPELRCDKASGFSGMGSSLKREGTNQTAMIYVQAIACPPKAQSANLKLGVAEGNWETVFSTAKPRVNLNAGWCGEQTSDNTGLWEANVQMTEGKGGDVVLAFNYCSKDDYETRIVYVNADGTAVPLRGNGSYGAGGLIHGITSLSSADYAQVNAFQLQRRRYEWVEFRNVSLQPGNKTAVESVNTPGAEISQIFLPASSSPTQEPIQRRAAASATPALLAEKPKLQFLAWQDEWRAHEPRGAFHADGTAATEPEELRLLRHIQPIGCDDSGSAEGKLNPRFLHLWFSHPLIDRQSLNDVALLDSTGKPLEPRDGMLGSNARGTEDGDRFGWLTHTLSPGYAGNIPTAVTVRLRYSLGSWEHEQMFAPDENGIIALGNGSQFNGIGQNAKGTAFFSIAVDMKQDAARQFGVVAVTKDGRELQPSGGETGGGVGEAVHVQRFIFDTPLAEVAHFRLGTRPVRTVEFRNIPLPVNPGHSANAAIK